MDRLYFNFIQDLKSLVNKESFQLVNSYANYFKRHISALGKKFYLLEHKKAGMIPKHFLDALIKVDNAFNNNFLQSNKHLNVLNNIGIRLVNLDIKQAYWLCKKTKVNLVNAENLLFKANKEHKSEIKTVKDRFFELITGKLYHNLELKVKKMHFYKMNKPYNHMNGCNTKTTLDSPNIDKYIRLKKHTRNDILTKYNNLHKQQLVENLTNLYIPRNILNLLSLSDSANMFPKNLNSDILSMIADTETFLERIDTSDSQKNGIRNSIARKINNFMKGKNRHGDIIDKTIRRDLEDFIRFKNRNRDVYVVKSDKSKKVVFITKEMYNDKMHGLLNDPDTYRMLNKDPLVNVTNKINKYVDKLYINKYIDRVSKTKLTTYAPQHPRIYGLIKLHKENKPLRPIVNSIKGPSYKLEKFFKPFLNGLYNNNPFDVKNAFDAKNKIDDLKTLEENERLISFDVVSLFTSVPLEMVFEIISEQWEQVEPCTCIKDKVMFIEGLKIICENGFVKYDNKIYRQLTGLPMGGVLSVTLSGILMNKLLDDVISTTNIKPRLIMKYVDDLLLVLKEDEIDRFYEGLNGFHNNIKFTYELETNNRIRFLDMYVNNDNAILRTMWTRNENSSQRILSFISNHPRHMLINNLKNSIFKAIKLTDKKYISSVKETICTMFEINLYPSFLIKKYWNLNCNKIHNNMNCTSSGGDLALSDSGGAERNNMNGVFFACTYIKGLSECVRDIFKEYDVYEIRLANKITNKMSKFYTPLKDKILTQQQSDVVYEISCLQCPKIYIGETSQLLHKRMYQHQYDCKNIGGKEPNTALAQHTKTCKHQFDFENAKVVYKESDGSRRKLFEAMQIAQKIDISVNYKTDCRNLNQYYSETLNILKEKFG